MSDCALPARVLWVCLLPFGHELGQRVVGAFRGHDMDLDELVTAPTVLAKWYALAPQSQLRAFTGALRYLDVDSSIYGSDAHARAIQCLAE
jgi:outer membrane protein W